MKPKLKFDKDAIVGFAVQHVEKLVLGVVVVCCGMIVYGAVKRESYDKTPDQLEKRANDAQEHVKSTSPDDVEFPPAPPFFQIVSNILQPIEGKAYKYSSAWHEDVFPRLRLRKQPSLLAVEELCGSAHRAPFRLSLGGAVARREPGGRPSAHQGETVRGKRWIVVTGLVPIREQRDAYKETFKNAHEPNPQTDVPRYYYYWVERAKTDGSSKDLVWERLPRMGRHPAEAKAIYTNEGQEIIDSKYLEPHGYLTFPLGPRINEQQTEDIVRVGAHTTKGGTSAWSNDRSITHSKIPLPLPEEPEDETGEPDPSGADGLPVGELPPGEAARVRGGRGASRTFRHPGMAGTGEEAEEAEYWLFRYFDFSVKPGESYRYRVQLVLMNPNFRVETRYLEPDLAKEHEKVIKEAEKLDKRDKRGRDKLMNKLRFVTTAYSEATEVIHVPRDYEILLASVKLPSRSWDEPFVEMMVVQWVETCGKMAHHVQKEVCRGNVLNYPNKKFPPVKETRAKKRVKKPRRGKDGEEDPAALGMEAAMVPAPEPGSQDRIDVSYMTESIVLDVAGGVQGKEGGPPARVILLDVDGGLIVCDEVDDAPKVTDRRKILEALEPKEDQTKGIGPPRRDRPAGPGLDRFSQ